MPRRRLLPALRRPSLERKSLSITGYGGVTPRIQTYGFRDSAAGWDMNTVVTEGYERVVWVYKAVEIISGNASRLPFNITADEDEEVESHPLLRAMNKQANPHETGRAFRKRLSAQVLLSKRGAFVEVTKSRAGQITRLDLLPPDRIRIVPDPAGDYVQYFEFTRYDGEIRNLSPERVRWIREPHPIDPFSGTTPLEAAGMSVELDHLARAYNVSFINRDGRPGGILGVDADGIDEDELDRIQDRLKPGAYYAGAITALGTGPGGIDYVDTSSKPRDMAYETTSDKARKEILAAFGVPESIAGDASERTYDNAEAEKFSFWHETMVPHLELIAGAFDGDLDDDLDCGFDTSDVEALELPARRRREEARQEWDKGLRTVKEYRETAGLDEIDNPQTRALWISPAKAPVPGQPGDAAALGLSTPDGGGLPGMPGGPGAPGAPQPPGAAPGGEQPAQTAHEVVQEALSLGDQPGEAASLAPQAPEGPAVQAVADASMHDEVPPGPAAAALDDAKMEGKAHPHSDQPRDTGADSYDPGHDSLHRVELAVAAALDALLARQAGVVTARLESPKIRKGTRYWEAQDPQDDRAGDAPINSERVVDPQRWAGETQQTLQPIAGPAGSESAADLLGAMAAAGALAVPLASAAVVAGRTMTAPAPSKEDLARAAAQAALAPAMLAVTIAEQAMTDWLNDRAADIDKMMLEDQLALPDLVAAVQKMWAEKSRAFADSLAVTVAQTVTEGAREAAAGALQPDVSAPRPGEMYVVPAHVEREWHTREDERVRETHRHADGQVRILGEPFDVGGYPLRYPCDPLAPPSQTRWCRCWLIYSWPKGAKFTMTDAEPGAES